MKLPVLNNWQPTARGLHQAAQLLGGIRMLVQEPVPNFLELALRIEATGLATDMLPSGGSVILDFSKAALVVSSAKGKTTELPINRQTQTSLLEKLLQNLEEQGQSLGSSPKDFLAALHAKGHKLDGSLELTSTETINVNAKVSADYGQALYRVFTATARWRARLVGQQTSIVVWPEHFDLSTLWFATDKANESSPHINFGFAPFDGTHTHPYLYAYAYPMPEGFDKLPLPKSAHWNTSPWKGMVVPYEELAKSDNPEAEIEGIFEAVYNILAPTLIKKPETVH
jgi:Family of unknown function (DUF5996)